MDDFIMRIEVYIIKKNFVNQIEDNIIVSIFTRRFIKQIVNDVREEESGGWCNFKGINHFRCKPFMINSVDMLGDKKFSVKCEPL